MLSRLGSVVLAAVLLGVPRVLDAGAFGAQPSVYLAVATMDPKLRGFAAEPRVGDRGQRSHARRLAR